MGEAIESNSPLDKTGSFESAPKIPSWAVGAALAGALLPALVLGIVVRRYAVDVPYFDEWQLASLIRKSLKGTLQFHDFYVQHTAHRILVPRIILLGLARATGWDTRYELAVNLALGCGIASLFALRAAAMAEEFRSRMCLFLVPVFSMFALSLAQHENWMWGWQNQILLVMLAAASSLFLLAGPRFGYGRFTAAIATALIATYSFANGLLIWPLGLLALVYPGLRAVPPRRMQVAIWIVVSIVVFVAYFYDYSLPQRREGGQQGRSVLGNVAEYFLAYLGGAFAASELPFGIAVGACGLLVSLAIAGYLLVARPVRPEVYVPGLLLWLFGLGSGVLTVFGRADFGASQALSSRYTTISNPFWIGTLMMLAAACYAPAIEARRSVQATRWGRAAFCVFVVAMTAGTLRADVLGLDSVRQFSHLERVLRYKLLQGVRDEQMLLLAPSIKWLEGYKTITQRNHLWAWRPNAPASMFDPPPAAYDGQMSAPPGSR